MRFKKFPILFVEQNEDVRSVSSKTENIDNNKIRQSTGALSIRVFQVTNGTVFSGWFEPSRPSPSRTNFRAKIRNKQGNQKMADSLSILRALELLDDYEVEISEVLDEDDDITLFSVGSSYMRRNLNRVRDYFEGTIPLYFPDEYGSLQNDKRNLRAVHSRRHAHRKDTTWEWIWASCHPTPETSFSFPLVYG